MANPVGESEPGVLRLDFDRRPTLQFRAPLSPLMPGYWPTANSTTLSLAKEPAVATDSLRKGRRVFAPIALGGRFPEF
jgi:hypothetical protein